MKRKERLLRARHSLVVSALFALVAGYWLAGEGPSSDAAWLAEANLPELPLKQTVSQYGITWTFDQPVPVGQFVNGDYYIVGPVTVVEIDPRPRFGLDVEDDELDHREKSRLKDPKHRLRNGSMLNPLAAQRVDYDSGIRNYFRPELAARLPIKMKPGDSLVSTVSLKIDEKNDFPYHGSGRVRGDHDNSPVKTAAVLTCMAEPQPPDAFRPSYCDPMNEVYLARNLRRELLKQLPRPDNAPKLDTWVRAFQRPWVNTGFFGFDQPMENMPHYGQWVGQSQSMASRFGVAPLPGTREEEPVTAACHGRREPAS